MNTNTKQVRIHQTTVIKMVLVLLWSFFSVAIGISNDNRFIVVGGSLIVPMYIATKLLERRA